MTWLNIYGILVEYMRDILENRVGQAVDNRMWGVVCGAASSRRSRPAHASASRSNLKNTSHHTRHQVTRRTLAPAHTPSRPSLSSKLHTNLQSTSYEQWRATCG
jgi:hypothetical protein